MHIGGTVPAYSSQVLLGTQEGAVKRERKNKKGKCIFFDSTEDLSNRRKGKVVWKDEYEFREKKKFKNYKRGIRL